MSLGDFFSSLFPTPATPPQPAPLGWTGNLPGASTSAPPPPSAPTLEAPPPNDALDHLAAVLATVAPRLSGAAVAEWASALAPWLRKYGITTAETLAMFAGQVAHESGGFSVLQENLRYTTATRLCVVWPSRFPSIAAAAPYVNNPAALANLVYGGRMGNTLAGDGWRFRGEGLIELTGRFMYAAFGQTCGKTADEAAQYLLTTEGAARSACWFWDYRHINIPAQAWNIKEVTRLVNGGVTDIEKRTALCEAALPVARGLHMN